MRIRLMSYIPDNRVIGHIKYTVERNRKFHYAKIGSQMTAVVRNSTYYFFTNFMTKHRKFANRYFTQIFRRIYHF